MFALANLDDGLGEPRSRDSANLDDGSGEPRWWVAADGGIGESARWKWRANIMAWPRTAAAGGRWFCSGAAPCLLRQSPGRGGGRVFSSLKSLKRARARHGGAGSPWGDCKKVLESIALASLDDPFGKARYWDLAALDDGLGEAR